MMKNIDTNGITQFLKLINSYVHKKQEIEKTYESIGLYYNVFDVLGLTCSEVRLHSSLLASLLGSKGHGAKHSFLEEFLRIPSLGLNNDFLDLSRVVVEVEKIVGKLTQTEGGRIDIFISDGHQSIIIENKIYSLDQDNQLLRYHNYKPDAKLVYLTLLGGYPSSKSTGQLGHEKIICLSYKYDIIPWLERCAQIAANLPYVRETIYQYINTLKRLTNTAMTTNEDIVEIISQPENINAAFAVQENLNSAINKAMNFFLLELKRSLSKDSSFKCITEIPSNWLDGHKTIQFEHKDWRNIYFAIEFEVKPLAQMGIGLLKKNNCINIQAIDGAKVLADRMNYRKSNTSWLWGYPTDSFAHNWYNARTIQMLLDGRMVEWFHKQLDSIDEQSKDLIL